MGDRPARILIVEDDVTLREIMEEVMVDEGYDVRLATNGRDGLAAIDSWEPDVVLLDVMMPRMDAFELRAMQRRSGIGPSAKLVLLSAARDLEAIADELGADAYLPKPFRLDEVTAAVERLVSD